MSKRKIEEVKIPEHPFPFPELRPYQKQVFDHIQKSGMPLPRYFFPRQQFVGVDLGQKGGDKSVVVQGVPNKKGGFDIIAIDEWSTMPEYKWYRNPIKWWKWRRLWKKIMDIPPHDTYRLEQLSKKKESKR